MTTDIQKIQSEVIEKLADKETMTTLVATTFKGLDEKNIKQAIVEGMLRGFRFEDFLEKNIYAIPFNNKSGLTYSLVTSIDYARKIGMRSGVVGKSEPTFEMSGNKIIACSITIKRKVGNEVGEFSSKVYFEEYTTGQNLWIKKPRTMISKVAEMHALRMACPEEMSQVYVEEEMEQPVHTSKIIGKATVAKLEPIDMKRYEEKLEICTNLSELRTAWNNLPQEAKSNLEDFKNHLKETLQ